MVTQPQQKKLQKNIERTRSEVTRLREDKVRRSGWRKLPNRSCEKDGKRRTWNETMCATSSWSFYAEASAVIKEISKVLVSTASTNAGPHQAREEGELRNNLNPEKTNSNIFTFIVKIRQTA